MTLFHVLAPNKTLPFQKEDIKVFHLYNLQGQLVLSVSNPLAPVLIGELSSGLYIALIETDAGFLQQQKVLVE